MYNKYKSNSKIYIINKKNNSKICIINIKVILKYIIITNIYYFCCR